MIPISVLIIAGAIAATIWLQAFVHTDEDERWPIGPSLAVAATGAFFLFLYFGLEIVLSTITGTPKAAEPIFDHGVIETAAMFIGGIWMVLIGAISAANRSSANRRTTSREIRDLRAQLSR
ncbi:MAG: hypothetical protein Q8P61_06575 [Candidatus Nanopelagicales bacterium]|nr:hypothetical protein [Candidatus Nanopelagicales bacterium]